MIRPHHVVYDSSFIGGKGERGEGRRGRGKGKGEGAGLKLL